MLAQNAKDTSAGCSAGLRACLPRQFEKARPPNCYIIIICPHQTGCVGCGAARPGWSSWSGRGRPGNIITIAPHQTGAGCGAARSGWSSWSGRGSPGCRAPAAGAGPAPPPAPPAPGCRQVQEAVSICVAGQVTASSAHQGVTALPSPILIPGSAEWPRVGHSSTMQTFKLDSHLLCTQQHSVDAARAHLLEARPAGRLGGPAALQQVGVSLQRWPLLCAPLLGRVKCVH